jgi:hypothetical protein
MTGRKKMQERMSAKRKDAKKTAASKPKVRVLKPGDKVATKKKQTFAQAFAAARKEKGAGKVFTWNGKRYSTNTADDKKKTTAKKTTAKKTTAKKTTAKKTTAKKVKLMALGKQLQCLALPQRRSLPRLKPNRLTVVRSTRV